MKKRLGKFIIFEGIDGTGKTTVSNELVDRLRRFGFKVLLTREPGSSLDIKSEYRDKIRNLIFESEKANSDSLLFLFLADRVEHYKFLNAELENNDFIVCDRSVDSTLVYQHFSDFANTTFSLEEINYLNSLTTNNLKPHKTFLLDADPNLIKDRLFAPDKNNHFDNAEISKKESAREAYLNISKLKDNYVVVDALLPSYKVTDICFNSLKEFFSGR